MAANSFNPQGGYINAYTIAVAADGSTVAAPTTAALDSANIVKAPTYTFKGAQLSLACDTAVGLTVPTGARYAQIQAAVQNVRYRYGTDAGDPTTPTNPTTTTGMRLLSGSELACDVATISNMRFIAETAGALLNVSYFS